MISVARNDSALAHGLASRLIREETGSVLASMTRERRAGGNSNQLKSVLRSWGDSVVSRAPGWW